MKKLLILVAVLCLGRAAFAQTPTSPYTVDKATDELDTDYSTGDFSLREAVYLANSNAGSTINFASGLGDVHISTGTITITKAVTIDGGSGQNILQDLASGYAFTMAPTAASDVTFKYLNLGIDAGHSTNSGAGFTVGSAYKTTLLLDHVNTALNREVISIGCSAIYTPPSVTLDYCSIASTVYSTPIYTSIGICGASDLTFTNTTIKGTSKIALSVSKIPTISFTDCNLDFNCPVSGGPVAPIVIFAECPVFNIKKTQILRTYTDGSTQTNYPIILNSFGTDLTIDSCNIGIRKQSDGSYTSEPIGLLLDFFDNTAISPAGVRGYTIKNSNIFGYTNITGGSGAPPASVTYKAYVLRNHINEADSLYSGLINNTSYAIFKAGAIDLFQFTSNKVHEHASFGLAPGVIVSNFTKEVVVTDNRMSDYASTPSAGPGICVDVQSFPAASTSKINISRNVFDRVQLSAVAINRKRTGYTPYLLTIDAASIIADNAITNASTASTYAISVTNCAGTLTVTGPSDHSTAVNNSVTVTGATKHRGIQVSNPDAGTYCNVIFSGNNTLYNAGANANTGDAAAILLENGNLTSKPAPVIQSMVNNHDGTYNVTLCSLGTTVNPVVDCYTSDKVRMTKAYVTSATASSGTVTFTNLTAPIDGVSFWTFTATYAGYGTSQANEPKLFNEFSSDIDPACSTATITFVKGDPYRYFINSSNYPPTNTYNLESSMPMCTTTSTGGYWAGLTANSYTVALNAHVAANPGVPDVGLRQPYTVPYKAVISAANPTQTVCEGSTATLNLTNTSSHNLTVKYEWQYSSSSSFSSITVLSSGTIAADALPNYTTTALTSSPATRYYRLKAYNSECSTATTANTAYAGPYTVTVTNIDTPSLQIVNCVSIGLVSAPTEPTATITWHNAFAADPSVILYTGNTYTPTGCGKYFAKFSYPSCGFTTSAEKYFSAVLSSTPFRLAATDDAPTKAEPAATVVHTAVENNSKAVIYPNPTSGSFDMKLNAEMRISNMQGQLVYTAPVSDLNNLPSPDLSNLPTGVYMVSLHVGGAPVIRQTVVKK
ncbi:MAG: T9SS type A sorting domain-containing protein [Bacteroidota bacterium]